MSKRTLAQFRGVVAAFRKYWRIYGGWRALITSPYFAASLVATALAFPLWWQADWWDMPISVLPSILSFSLGGFALFLSLGDERFRAALAGSRGSEGNKPSPYVVFAVTFMHFILLQLFALMASILSKAWYMVPAPIWFAEWNAMLRPAVWGLGFWVFIYSLFAAVAAVMAIFLMVRAFDQHQTEQKNNTAPSH